jgi:N-acetylmuramoyl-L-alanine amidase-like protein
MEGTTVSEPELDELDEALDPEIEEAFEVDVDPTQEERDIHEADEALGEEPDEEGREIKPRSVRAIRGMGKVYDYRGTGLCPPNGGRIRPLIMVHHIPVVPNLKGTADFVRLGNVLRAQRLAIQAATDAEGNVALYTRFDQLCHGQRGANVVGCGVEHMHMTVGEDWTEKQMRAAAWCANQVWASYGIPPHRAVLTPGNRTVGVRRRGHTSHQNVSKMAGFNDRSDPGSGFNYVHMYELTRHYSKHGKF